MKYKYYTYKFDATAIWKVYEDNTFDAWLPDQGWIPKINGIKVSNNLWTKKDTLQCIELTEEEAFLRIFKSEILY